MTEVNIHYAKTHLSRLLVQVASGEQVVISKGGKPVARLVPIEQPPTPLVLGQMRGKFSVPDDFNDPLPDELINEFGL